MEKEFTQLTRKELRDLSLHYRGYKVDLQEFGQLLKERDAELIKLLTLSGSWGCLYELPYAHVALAMFYVVGKEKAFIDALRKKDPVQNLITLMESDDDVGELSEEQKALFLGFFMAIIGNMEALEAYSLQMCELLEKGKNDDEYFLRAVRTDRTVVESSPVANRIALAHITQDESFLNALAKAITRTKPRPQKKEFDETRLFLRILDDAESLEKLKNAELDELLSDDLKIFPGNNSYDRLSKLLTETRNALRK